MPLESLEWITERERFAEIAREWDRIAGLGRTPFLTSSWIEAWCTAFAPRRRFQIAVLWRDGELVAALPLLAAWRRWDAPTNDHTPEFGLLATDSDARNRLVAEVLRRSDALVLPRLRRDDPVLDALIRAAHEMGRWTLVEETGASLVTDTSGSLEEYRANLSSKVRSEVGRLRRKAAREYELELTPLGTPHDLDLQLDRAFALEASGWKGRRGTAIISAPETDLFYRRIAGAFHAAGALRISEMSLDGKLVAMAFSIIHGRRAFTLKVGYDEQHRQLGPGIVLLMAMTERCFELGLEAYEFSGPEASYERRFATGEERYDQLRIYRPSTVNAARYLYHLRIRAIVRAGYRTARRLGMPDLRRSQPLSRSRWTSRRVPHRPPG